MPCLTLIVTLELDLHIAVVSSPTLHSAVVLLSVVSRLRAGSHVIGWPSWMEWDGREQRPSCCDIFSSLCLPLAFLEKQPKRYCSIWLQLGSFRSAFLSLCFSSCGKRYTAIFTRSSLDCPLVLNTFTVLSFSQPSNLPFSVKYFSLD